MNWMVDGRISWPLVFMAVYTTVLIVLTDYAWRTVNISILILCLVSGILLVAGNLLLWRKAASR